MLSKLRGPETLWPDVGNTKAVPSESCELETYSIDESRNFNQDSDIGTADVRTLQLTG